MTTPHSHTIHQTDGLGPGEAEELAAFLGHKGSPWMDHVRAYFAREGYSWSGLNWTFHLARDESGAVVSTICVWESGGIGLLGHVYTIPEARGRGLSRKLLRSALECFKAGGGRRLHLNCETGSFIEAFYASEGFEAIPDVGGSMVWCAEGEGWPPRRREGGAVTVVPFCWAHWPRLNELFLLPGAPAVRSPAMGLEDGPASVEGPLLKLLLGRERPAVMVLEGGNGETVGFGCRMGERVEIHAPAVAEDLVAALRRAL